MQLFNFKRIFSIQYIQVELCDIKNIYFSDSQSTSCINLCQKSIFHVEFYVYSLDRKIAN